MFLMERATKPDVHYWAECVSIRGGCVEIWPVVDKRSNRVYTSLSFYGFREYSPRLVPVSRPEDAMNPA